MNINSQELLLINKNMKFGETPTIQTAESVVEPPENKPETGLNALNAQAQNNISFQGVTIPSSLKKGLSKMMLIMALGGGAMATTGTLSSCTEELIQSANVTIDMSQMTALYQQMIQLYQEMLELQKINNQELNAMKQYVLELLQEVQKGNKSQAEFQQAVYEYMMEDSAIQKLILEQLITNGKSQEEANKWLKQLIADVQSGKVSYETAVKQIMDILNNIDSSLTELKELYQQILDLYTQMLDEQLISNQELAEAKDYLATLLQEVQEGNKSQAEFQKAVYRYMIKDSAMQKLILKQLTANGKSQEEANKWLQQLIADVQSGKVSYETAVKQIMGILNNIDSSLTELKELYQQILDLYTQMLDEQLISNQELAEAKDYLATLLQEVEKGNKSQAEFQQVVYRYMMQDSAIQKFILKQLVANGKSQEEANKWLKQLIADVQSGKVSYETAVKQIMDILGSIDATLKNILEQVIGIRDDMNTNHQQYMATKEEELYYLGKIYQTGKISQAYLKLMAGGISNMNKKLTNIENSTAELLVIAQDDTKFKELMNKLDQLDLTDEDYQKFEEMFKLLNMNLQDAINQSKADNKKGQQAIIGAINAFKQTYIYTEAQQSKQLGDISKKLTFILNYLPNINQEDIKNAIEALTDALKNNTGAIEDNTEVVGSGLDSINSKLDVIIGQLDTVINKLSDFETNFANQNANWKAALKLLGEANQSLKEIKAAQKITNTYLAGFKNDFAELKKSQQTANSYLYILTQKADQLEAAIKDINVNGGGMTRDEFLSAMKERDQERDTKLAADFEQFIKDYGFDKVPGDVQTIKEFLAEIKNAVQNQKDYSTQLDKIIGLENDIYNFLKTIDFSKPDCVTKLNKIITILENFKCNCECGKSDESVKDAEDLEDMFS